MKALRIVGLVLAGWAVAATIYVESGIRAWISPPRSTAPPARKVVGIRDMAAWAGAAGVLCLLVAAVFTREWTPRPVPLSPEPSDDTAPTV
jgi:hypothetical protein